MDWQKAKRDLLLALSSHFLYKIAGYVILTILTRYLAKDKMGEFFFASALATFFVLVTELGTSQYLVREIARNPEKALDYFSEVISLRIPLFVLYFFIIGGFTFIFKPDLIMVVLLTSVYTILDELYGCFGALFLGLKKVAYNMVAGVSSRLLLVGFIFVVVTFKGGLIAVLICYILAGVILVGTSFVLLWRKIGRLKLFWSPDSARRILRVSFPFFVMTVLGLIHFKIDSVMLGFMKPYSVLASYEAAYKLLEASRFLVLPLGMVFYPVCSEMAARQNWQEIQTIQRKMLLITALLGCVIALGVVISAGFLIPIVFGSKYNDSISILRILYLCVPMLYTASVGIIFAKSLRLETRTIKIMLVCAIINIVLNSMAIPLWGGVGAAWATLASQTVLTVWLIGLNLQELRILCSAEAVTQLRGEWDHVR